MLPRGVLDVNFSSSDDESDEDYKPSGNGSEGGGTGNVGGGQRRRRAIPLEEQVDDDENAQNLVNEDDDDLPSIDGTTGRDRDRSTENEDIDAAAHSNISLASVDSDRGEIENANSREIEMDHEDSLLSVEEIGNRDESNRVSNGPVGGFRVRVGPDGEEIVEFASDSDSMSDDDDEDDPSWNQHIGVEPAVEFAIPASVVASIAQRVNQRRASLSPDRRSGVANASASPEPSTSSGQRTPRARTGVIRPRKKPARKRRQRKAKKPKKKKPSKPKAPPKPLGPLFIYEDWNGNDDYKDYLKRISKTTQFKLHINFREVDDQEASFLQEIEDDIMNSEIEIATQGMQNKSLSQQSQKSNSQVISSLDGYKVGQFQFDRCGVQPWTWKNKSELLAAFPGISDLTLHVSQNPSSSILHMKTKTTLRGEDISQRTGPPPRLSKRDSERELVYVVTRHYFYHVDPVGIPFDLFSVRGLGNRKTFTLDFNRFVMERQCFIFDIVLLESTILGEHSIDEIPLLKHSSMQDVFANFLGLAPPPPPCDSEAHQKEDIEWFHGQIRKYHKQEELPHPDVPLQPPSLKPTLRNYQRDAVQWMLYREGCLDHCVAHSSKAYQNRVDLAQAFQDRMYTKVELTRHVPAGSTDIPEKKIAFYNPYTAYMCWSKPSIPPVPKGGILCDEMGLGKTVEMLCLILLNEKPIPDHLKEYFGNKTERNDSKENKKAADDISSSSSEEIPSDCSESSFEERVSKKKRREVKSGGKRKKQKLSGNKASKRRNSRRRAASPCVFTAAHEVDSEPEDIIQCIPSTSPKKTVTVLDALEQKLKAQKSKTRNKSAAPEDKPPSTFEKLKVLYDSALNQYKYAEMAKSTPKFHGKFYEVELELRACFECICGGSDEEYHDDVVQCSVCSSSQHAECVGFDTSLKNLFEKIGRPYLCPHCEALEPPFETKSTLIITPQSISHQWIKEIQKHVQNRRLNILFYKGVSTHGYIPPAKLARYDIVITTYSVLSSELDYVDLPHCNSVDGRRLRNPKRFLTIPSPLPSVLWWRVCLDEAQMVEGIGTKMSMMAMRFEAVHRWCVTGTPVNKGLQDVFGLFVFMRVCPISYDIWWDALVRDAFYRKETNLLYELFGQMMWRNGKQDVLDQLGIPPQTELVHWLNFSPVETHFYKQQFEICSSRILEKINRLRRSTPEIDILTAKLSSLDRFSLHGLLAPFLELRQACCHPQIVKGQLISLQKGTLTMEELLDRLVKKTQLQCHEDHRLVVAALNGMAGLHIILDDWKEAANKYREVLQSAEKHKEHFNTDSLQLLHTLENLAEIIDGNHHGVPFTLRDESLRSEAADVRKKYMEKYSNAVKSAKEAVTPLTSSVDEIRSQFTMHKQSWWVTVLKNAQGMQKIDSLVQTLKQDLMDVTKKNVKRSGSIANKFQDRYGLEQALVQLIMEMEGLRDTVLEGLDELQDSDPAVFVESAIRCHLRQKSNSYYNDSGEGDEKCKLCSYHDSFLFYESVIFKADMKDKITRTGRNYQQRKLMGAEVTDELTEETKNELLQQEAEDLKATTEHVQLINEELRRGTWGDSETEVVLKGILRFARINKLAHEITNDGGVHIKLLEAVKKEFRFLRVLWRQIYDQVSALDELSQATTRLIAVAGGDFQSTEEQPGSSRNLKQLRSGIVEKTLKIQTIHVIGHHEIEPRMGQMKIDFATGQESLAIHLGQLLYLKTLKRNGYGKKGTTNSEDCPICSTQLGKEWSVLRCGHSFCSECVKKMCPNALQSFLCPLCRHSMKFADVSFVDTTTVEKTGIQYDNGDVASTSACTSDPVPKKEVKGSHSTKIEAIIETLLKLQDTHPGEKCIIFSMWSDVLEILAKALTQNDIRFSLLNQPGRPFHTNLDKFKEREDLQVLLMPLTSGAKGLNIIEATHVLLVEPILNIASELQAIGRVHRIGQTRPTFVHRFYVKRTIEDKLFQILKGQDISSDEEGSLTVKDLQNLVTVSK